MSTGTNMADLLRVAPHTEQSSEYDEYETGEEPDGVAGWRERLRQVASAAGSRRGVMAPGRGWSGVLERPNDYQVTSTQGAGLYPHVGTQPIPQVGCYIGMEWLSSAGMYFDPMSWIRLGLVTNPGVMIMGAPGLGKSALIKSILLRMLILKNTRCFVASDSKNEYSKLVRALGYEPHQIGGGLSGRINPLDAGPLGNLTGLDSTQIEHRLGEIKVRRLSLLTSLLAARKYETSSSDEATLVAALDVLTGEATHEGRLATPLLPDVHRILADPPESMVKLRRYEDQRQMLAETRAMTDALSSLISGALSGLFDAPTTVPVDFTAPIQSMDISRLESRGDEALAVALVCLGAWGNAATELRKPGEVLIQPSDEIWRLLRLGPRTVEWLDSDLRLSRTTGKINLMAMHKPSDPATAGATGSHASNIAEGMLALCGTTVMYGNQKSVVQDLAERVGLNDREVYELTTWARQGRGRALWRVGTRTYKVQQVLTTRERELFETDMAEAPEPALISS